MAGPEAIAVVRDTCLAIAGRHGLELVDVSVKGGGRNLMVSVILDRVDGPLTLGEIAEVSEEISRALDVEDPIESSYTLEVSSAGIERPLIKPADYQRFLGREAKVKLHAPIEGRRNFQGTIRSAGDETFVLAMPEAVTEIPYTEVYKAKLVVDWDEELKKASKSEIADYDNALDADDIDEMTGGTK